MSGPDLDFRGYGVYVKTQQAVPEGPAQDQDAAAVGAIRAVAEGGQPNALFLLKRFLREVKYHDFLGKPASAPFGRPLAPHYQLERLDPQHRFGERLPNAVARGPADNARLAAAREAVLLFLHQDPTGTATRFLEWVGQRRPAQLSAVRELLADWQAAPPPELQQLGMVRYLDNLARQSYVVEPGTDGLVYRRKLKADAVGVAAAFAFDTEPFDTARSQAAWGGRQRKAIWVQGPSGRFYSSLESRAGAFHHSSFLEGHDVKAAGDWEIAHGKLLTISAMSGHYQPTIQQLHGAVVDLRKVARSLLDQAVVEVKDVRANRRVDVAALDFADGGERDVGYLRQYSPQLG